MIIEEPEAAIWPAKHEKQKTDPDKEIDDSEAAAEESKDEAIGGARKDSFLNRISNQMHKLEQEREKKKTIKSEQICSSDSDENQL